MGFFWDFYSRLFEKIPWDFFPMGLGFFKKFTHAPGFFDKGWDSIDIRKNVLPKKIVYQTVAGLYIWLYILWPISVTFFEIFFSGAIMKWLVIEMANAFLSAAGFWSWAFLSNPYMPTILYAYILSPPHFVSPHFVSFPHFVSRFWALENETIRRNQVFSNFSGLNTRKRLNSFQDFSFFTDRIFHF